MSFPIWAVLAVIVDLFENFKIQIVNNKDGAAALNYSSFTTSTTGKKNLMLNEKLTKRGSDNSFICMDIPSNNYAGLAKNQ